MNNKPKPALIRVSSVLMLFTVVPMLLWCLNLIDNATLDYTYAGVGCFAAGMIYIFSIVTAVAGLIFAIKPHRYRWCQALGSIQLVAGMLLIVPLRSYAALTLPPLFLLTILYLFGVGWHKKRDYEQQ